MITALEVQRYVADSFRIPLEKLQSRRRTRQYSYPRMLAMHLVREIIGGSYPEIAEQFGIHHTSVMHACRWAVANEQYREYIRDTIRRFRNAEMGL